MAKKKTAKTVKKKVKKKAKKKAVKKKLPVDEMVVDGGFLFRLYEVNLRTIQRWVKEKNLPNEGRDKYDLRKVIVWREQMLREELNGQTRDEKRLVSAQANEREAKAEIQIMSAKKMRGELIDLETIEQNMLERIVAVKTALRAVSITISKRVIGVEDENEVGEIVEDEIYQCMLRFASGEEITEVWRVVAENYAEELKAPLARLKKIADVKKMIMKVLMK